MGKIKTQALIIHQRTLLLHVFAQDFSQRGLEEMGRGMVASDRQAPGNIDPGVESFPFCDPSVKDRTDMDKKFSDTRRVRDLNLAVRRDQDSAVSDLASGLAVKWCLVQDDLDAVAGLGLPGRLIILEYL